MQIFFILSLFYNLCSDILIEISFVFSLFSRDVSGAYLAPIGSKAVLKSRSNTVTRDELFSLEDSLPQASFVAALNQRYVSVKQGEFFILLSHYHESMEFQPPPPPYRQTCLQQSVTDVDKK